MTNNGYRDTPVALHRRFTIEANATPLLSSHEEQRLARRIETARRRLLSALASWPDCIPQLLASNAQPQGKITVITGIHDADPLLDDAAGATLIAQRLNALAAASQRYREALADLGWSDPATCEYRRRAASLLASLRVHPRWVGQLVRQAGTADRAAWKLPWTAIRARIAANYAALLQQKQRMVQANLRLVIAMARRYRNSHVPQADLIQEGNLGLLRAVEKFDYRRGCKFSTYAIWWIQRAIVLEITMQRSVLSVPAYALQAAQRMQRRAADQRCQNDTPGRFEELAASETMSHADLRAAQRACLPALSLHGEVDDERAPINTLEDEGQSDPCELLQQRELRERVHAALSHLPPRQADVLRLRFGIGSAAPHTLDAIGQQFGLSRERIRQIEQQALAQLRVTAQRGPLTELIERRPPQPLPVAAFSEPLPREIRA